MKQTHITSKVENNEKFAEIVTMIKQTRASVVRLANHSLIDLYWRLGKLLSDKIDAAEWGDSVVEQLAQFIAANAPGIKGFSDKNLWRMKKFYETYRDSDEKLSPLVREISWTNNLLIMSRTKSAKEREFYLRNCVKERWSKRELNREIDTALYERTLLGKPKLSPLVREINPYAEQVFRDQYILEFVGGKDYRHENDLRRALVMRVKDLVLELGKDFIFISDEYDIQVGNSDFRIDLLFYHRELSCLVAFELKMGTFRPEYIGQLNFYLEALDRNVKKKHENPSIGVLLCKDKDNEVVEYALSRSLSPTMVAEYQLCLPDKQLLQQKMKELFDDELDS